MTHSTARPNRWARSLLGAVALVFAASPSFAEYIEVPATGSVAEVADRLEAAAQKAGATVFARVDHASGAAAVDMELPDATLVIFGNPMLGTPAMQQDVRAGVVLPLRVLVADEDGKTMLIYQSVDAMFADTDVDTDAEFAKKMTGALDKLTAAAAKE